MRKKLFLCLLACLMCIMVKAATFNDSITFFGHYNNGESVTNIGGDYFNIAFSKGTNNYEPRYYDLGEAVRVYGGNTFTVSSSLIITKIEFTFGSGDVNNEITTDVGTYSDSTWTGFCHKCYIHSCQWKRT